MLDTRTMLICCTQNKGQQWGLSAKDREDTTEVTVMMKSIKCISAWLTNQEMLKRE